MLQYTQLAPNFHLVTHLVPDRYKLEFNLHYTSGGALFETQGQRGVSHLLEHCILGRTKDKDFQTLKDYLFEKSIYNNAATGVLSMYLTLSGHRADAKEMLDLLLEFGFDPALSQDVLDREREVVLREISERRGEPNYRLFFETAKKAFEPDSRYLHEVLGDPEDVKNATLDTFYDLHRGMLQRSHIIVSACGGGVETAQLIDQLQNLSHKIKPNEKTLAINFDPGNRLKKFSYLPVVYELAHDQAELSLAIPVNCDLESRPARFFLQSLFLRVPDGELYNRLRNELGLIYSLQASFDKSSLTLNLEMMCEIKYITQIVGEVKKLFSDFESVYSPKKAEILRKMTIKKQELAQDEPQIVTDFVVDNLTEFGVPLTYKEYVDKLADVSTEQIKAVYDEIKANLDSMRIIATSNKSEIEKLVF